MTSYTYNQVFNVIREYFIARGPLLPCVFGNAPPPAGDMLIDLGDVNSGLPWMQFHINLLERTQVEAGRQNTFKQTAEMVISFYILAEQGDGAAWAYADAMKGAFSDHVFGAGFVMQEPSVRSRGREGRWWVVETVYPFYFRTTENKLTGVAPSVTSTDFASVTSTIRSRFKTRIADVLLLPTLYDNAPDNVNKDGVWCRFTVLMGSTFRSSIAGRNSRFRTVGVAMALIHCPLEIGEAPALVVADSVVTAFQTVTDKVVTFKTPSPLSRGRSGNWWLVNVSCPFYSDQIR